jgi:hypothetical protein
MEHGGRGGNRSYNLPIKSRMLNQPQSARNILTTETYDTNHTHKHLLKIVQFAQ